jgi:hypothetical protein
MVDIKLRFSGQESGHKAAFARHLSDFGGNVTNVWRNSRTVPQAYILLVQGFFKPVRN